MPVEKSAGAIIFYREKNKEIKYLLLHHKTGYWNFPKGLVEEGESLEETAQRECREETGLKEIKLIPGFKETIKYFFKVKYKYQIKERGFRMGQTVLKFVTYFLAQSKSKNVKISFEHQGYQWLTFKEALKRLEKYKNNQRILKKANDFISKKNF